MLIIKTNFVRLFENISSSVNTYIHTLGDGGYAYLFPVLILNKERKREGEICCYYTANL